jgi:hypothetical protein
VYILNVVEFIVADPTTFTPLSVTHITGNAFEVAGNMAAVTPVIEKIAELDVPVSVATGIVKVHMPFVTVHDTVVVGLTANPAPVAVNVPVKL